MSITKFNICLFLVKVKFTYSKMQQSQEYYFIGLIYIHTVLLLSKYRTLPAFQKFPSFSFIVSPCFHSVSNSFSEFSNINQSLLENFLFGNALKLTEKFQEKEYYKEHPYTLYPDSPILNVLPHLFLLYVCRSFLF